MLLNTIHEFHGFHYLSRIKVQEKWKLLNSSHLSQPQAIIIKTVPLAKRSSKLKLNQEEEFVDDGDDGEDND